MTTKKILFGAAYYDEYMPHERLAEDVAMIGAAGISAFPMSSRVVQKLALQEDPGNVLIMQAAGANVSGQIASVVAGGMVINLVSTMLR